MTISLKFNVEDYNAILVYKANQAGTVTTEHKVFVWTSEALPVPIVQSRADEYNVIGNPVNDSLLVATRTLDVHANFARLMSKEYYENTLTQVEKNQEHFLNNPPGSILYGLAAIMTLCVITCFVMPPECNLNNCIREDWKTKYYNVPETRTLQFSADKPNSPSS